MNLRACLTGILVVVFTTFSFGQEKVVTGTVTDAETGETLPGATVMEVGTSNGVITDLDGNYKLAVGDDASLQISFVGFAASTVKVGNQSIIDVALEADIEALEEVVVVGYGVQKKRDVTGALVSIGAEEIQERPVVNAVDAMQGKAAGVDITTNRRPGEVSSVRIRGNKSIDRSQPVLYVVDGIVLFGDLNDINPNDIKSIDILKDASATAIYGARGANGVVLITTKSGNKSVRINYSGTTSFDKINSLTEWGSAGNVLDRTRQAFINHPSDAVYQHNYPDPFEDIRLFGKNDYHTIQAIRNGYEWEDPGTYSIVKMRSTNDAERVAGYPASVPVYNPDNVTGYDWMDLLSRTGVTQNHTLSVSAGGDNSNLYASFGFLDNKAAQINQGYSRYTARINGDIKPKDWIKIGSSITATYSEQLYGSVYRSGSATGPKDIYGIGQGMYIMAQPYDSLGELITFPGNNSGLPVFNPLIDVNNTEDKRIRDYFQGNFYGEINFTPWLKYRVNFGAGIKNYRRGQFQGSESTTRRGADQPTAWASMQTSKNFRWMVENILYVDKTIDQHSIKATLLQSAQDDKYETLSGTSSGILTDNYLWYGLGNGTIFNTSSYYSRRTLESYMVRVNYSFRDKYLLTGTVRWDGASVLSKGSSNKWDYFPSFSLGWKMEEEPFMQNIPIISQSKLRIGYGETGNQGSVRPYESSGQLVQYDYIFGATPAAGYMPRSQPNENLTWERVAQTNFGWDFGFLQDRITGSAEYYQSHITNLIRTLPLPATTGYPEITANIAEIRNTGFEFSINSVNIDTRDFTWKTSMNFATNNEKIDKLIQPGQDLPGSNLFLGYPVSIYRTYEVDGLWQNTEEDLAEMEIWADSSGIKYAPGQWKPVDQNGDYRLTDEDRVITGTTNPKWTGGITNTFIYKGFTLSAFIYARVGQKYWADLSPGGVFGSGYVGNAPKASIDEYWSEDNPDAQWPALTIQSVNTTAHSGTRVNDGSFFIVRNISLTYNFDQKVLNTLKVGSLEVFGQILNPFIWGGNVVKAGINPDDLNGWQPQGDRVLGGLNNNRIIEQSYVFGVRLGL